MNILYIILKKIKIIKNNNYKNTFKNNKNNYDKKIYLIKL